jgi:monocyte-to-macrophage differentiation protein
MIIILIYLYTEHAANCLTHGCLIIPSFIAAQCLMSHAKTPAQYWSSIIYGNALIFLFSFSTIFHCSCFHPTYKYALKIFFFSSIKLI